jgi:hypothetical protein
MVLLAFILDDMKASGRGAEADATARVAAMTDAEIA